MEILLQTGLQPFRPRKTGSNGLEDRGSYTRKRRIIAFDTNGLWLLDHLGLFKNVYPKYGFLEFWTLFCPSCHRLPLHCVFGIASLAHD
jgi:hypothetical protein